MQLQSRSEGDFYCKPPVAISSHFNETKWIRAAHPVMEGVNDDHELSVDYCNVFEKSLEVSWIGNHCI